MPRPQFRLKTLLWLMVVVGAFFAGGRWEQYRYERELKSWDLDLEQAMHEALDESGRRKAARKRPAIQE